MNPSCEAMDENGNDGIALKDQSRWRQVFQAPAGVAGASTHKRMGRVKSERCKIQIQMLCNVGQTASNQTRRWSKCG